jgi:hypothetical protein
MHFVSVAALPPKNDSPLIIDANRMKTLPITFEGFQPVAGRFTQILELCRVM